MAYTVIISQNAIEDISALGEYVAENDCPENADRLIDQLEEVIRSLSDFPERGVRPKELVELGRNEYREIHFKPYRIFYHLQDEQVTVLLITDGRRDMRTLLQLRILS